MKAKHLLFALCAMLGTLSCDKLTDFIDAPQAPQAEYYTVSLGFEGDIEVEYEPLVRAQENSDFYGINVYYAPAVIVDEGAPIAWTAYARGLFDNTDDLTIKLLVGYQYKFVATMLKDGKERMLGTNNTPFYINGASTPMGEFIYGLDIFTSLGSGNVYLKNPQGIYHRPNVERYYGELEEYVPGENGGKAKIKMSRTSFGAKFNAKGELAKSGSLEIQMAEAPLMVLDLNDSNQISDIFSFSNVRAAWLDNNYSETFAVVLKYVREDGTVIPLGDFDITFKRNNTTVVKVNVGDGTKAGTLGFELEEVGEMEDNPELETEIENGEIVDTEVNTNK